MNSHKPSGKPTARHHASALADLPEPLAILFDLDGTLVDTVELRIEAWSEALGRAGITVDRRLLAGYIGSDGRWLAK